VFVASGGVIKTFYNADQKKQPHPEHQKLVEKRALLLRED